MAARHDDLVGRDNVRHLIDTPALMLDADAFEHNIRLMAQRVTGSGKALRPHAKTHRCLAIANKQIEAGAAGICCAKLGEAEIFAAGGIGDILITSPVVTPTAIKRLVALNERMPALKAVADNPVNVAAIAAEAGERPLTLFIDIDPGIRRTGVADAEEALAVADAIAATGGKLVYGGVQFYCGAHQHMEEVEARTEAIRERTGYARAIVEALSAHGFVPPVITGSGTGTHQIDLAEDFFTEFQIGSYIFLDHQYEVCAVDGLPAPSEQLKPSLFVDTSIIHNNSPGMVTVDAGFKALSTDGGTPRVVTPGYETAAYYFMGDEHGALAGFEGAGALGERISMIPPHCDPTVNLYNHIHVMRGDRLEAIWPIEARGASA